MQSTLDAVRAQLARDFMGKLLADEPMSRHTSFRTGGPADLMAIAASTSEIRSLVGAAQAIGIPWRVFGKGTNMLVADRGIRGLVIKNSAHNWSVAQRDEEGAIVSAEAGVACAHLASKTAQLGLAGFEFAILIPGSIGGAVVQNAGAHGGEMIDVLASVSALLPTGDVREYELSDLNLSYRNSRFKGQSRGETVLSANLRLRGGDASIITGHIHANRVRRTQTQPPEPSAGSVFKNPPGNYSGALIEQAGLKGFRLGAAQVSPKHANFIINTGGATAADLRALIEQVREVVFTQFGIALETEIEFVGEW
ncbi:MAG TPA: UDP-N-acetylmuramate dehydrogenase [Chloroflexota bacterium]|nr:UDP-N-acetylmuramate dehydrogenase [Chloroflexota bacterium]